MRGAMAGTGRIRARRDDVLDGRAYRFESDDCLRVLSDMPSECIDCVITSPPYWKQREYDVKPAHERFLIGNEGSPEEYAARLGAVFDEVHRVLKDCGSLWLNLGDKYQSKDMVGLPWMVAFELKRRGWMLRNDVIWNKMKGSQSMKDRLHTIHEYVFHFVKSRRYYYDRKSILITPINKPRMRNGKIQSATGVSGVRYRESIQKSVDLTQTEKRNALSALDDALEDMRNGKIVDFRMTIRGGQRIYHGSKASKSGRSRELDDKGYFVIRMHADGYAPNSIWNIVPEDEWRRDDHCAVFPVDLLKIPINSTCPKGGIVLDPFMGTGSAVLAAVSMGRRGMGIEISRKYVKTAESRMGLLYDRDATNPVM